MDPFTTYSQATKWAESIHATVEQPGRLTDGDDAVAVRHPNGMSRTASFPTGLTGAARKAAYEDAVRVACCELYLATTGA